ncbi:hypothetical protein J6590_052700 [Homalodisca vitripennis]|nr:hypothetical protein J6590_103090 [Homalodisca vitripennis]KAG8301522.1 hypothetical protein J6590_052700 [Homalodisca vitripennis]
MKKVHYELYYLMFYSHIGGANFRIECLAKYVIKRNRSNPPFRATVCAYSPLPPFRATVCAYSPLPPFRATSVMTVRRTASVMWERDVERKEERDPQERVYLRRTDLEVAY